VSRPCDAAHAASHKAVRNASSPLRARPDLTLPADSSLPGHNPAHEARCAALGNRDMSTPISATTTSAVRLPTPGMVSTLIGGAHELVDLLVEALDHGFQLVHVVQVHASQQGVVVLEASHECLAQLGDVGPQTRQRHLREHLWVQLAGDAGLDHLACRLAGDVTRGHDPGR
jgi:hypothetical protein